MNSVFVRFDRAEQIANFVRLLNRFECQADLKCGSRVVDARSIVAVISLAKDRVAELLIRSGESAELLAELAPYIVRKTA